MTELPLFPLNTVLFPNMPITLHIFEERYKRMMNRCITDNLPFGVVLIQRGQEVGRPAQPHTIGCSAQIAQVQPLQDGRLNLVALGQERFQIQTLNYDQPYLTGTVVEKSLRGEIGPNEMRTSRGLRAALTEYLHVLANVGEVEFNVDKVPDDPLELAYLAATLLQAPNDHKQRLLEIDDIPTLIHDVYEICRREIAVLRTLLEGDKVPDHEGPFSLN